MSTLEESLDVLACPRCGGHLAASPAAASERISTVHCEKCGTTYPLRDGILDFLSPLDNKTNP